MAIAAVALGAKVIEKALYAGQEPPWARSQGESGAS